MLKTICGRSLRSFSYDSSMLAGGVSAALITFYTNMLLPCALFTNSSVGNSARSVGINPAGSAKGGSDMIKGRISIYIQTEGDSSPVQKQHPLCLSSTRK